MRVAARRIVALAAALVVVVGLAGGAYVGVSKVRQAQADNRFVPGYHDPRTGETQDHPEYFSVLENEEIVIAFVVGFSPACSHCRTYATELVEAWEQLQANEITEGRIAFMMIAVGGLTDGEVKRFAKDFSLPPEFAVIAGVERGVGPDSVPYTDMIARHPTEGHWVQVTSWTGTITASELMGYVVEIIAVHDAYKAEHE